MTDREKNIWRGSIKDFTTEEHHICIGKLFQLFREYTKDLFGGKGLFSANAENLMTIDELSKFLNGDSGVGPNPRDGKGYCLIEWASDGTTMGGTIVVQALISRWPL